jgi:integrase
VETRSMPGRQRFGRVSVFYHHGAFYLYYRQGRRAQRQRIGRNAAAAECQACLLNAALLAEEAGVPIAAEVTRLFGGPPLAAPMVRPTLPPHPAPTTVSELRRAFLRHHEQVLGSALHTISRYATATAYLEGYARQVAIADPMAISATEFTAHLRTVEVYGRSPATKRRLLDNGVRYILNTTRSMYRHGIAQGLLSPDRSNPFSSTHLPRIRLRDAKPIFVFAPDQELAFFQAADTWDLTLHFVLAKTGLRPGEIAHLLVEEVDLATNWLTITNKADLGWTIKTGRERRVPLVPAVIAALRSVIGVRGAGPVFLRPRLRGRPELIGGRSVLAATARTRIAGAEPKGGALSRAAVAKIYERVWHDAGAVPEDQIRMSFIHTCQRAGLQATCVKSWRHTFATLMQEANVDVLVRQITLGHKTADVAASPLGMTAVYTHTTPEFQSREISRAVALRPRTLEFVTRRLQEQDQSATENNAGREK